MKVRLFAIFLMICVPAFSLASYEAGLSRFQTGQYHQAFRHWQNGAKQGDVRSKYSLSLLYRDGLGVKRNTREAFQLLLEAANQGDVQSQFELGNFYLRGIGVAKSSKSAGKWWYTAAHKNNVYAQFNLASLYYLGDGVQKDLKRAKFWYGKAASIGYKPAKNAITELEEKGVLDHVAAQANSIVVVKRATAFDEINTEDSPDPIELDLNLETGKPFVPLVTLGIKNSLVMDDEPGIVNAVASSQGFRSSKVVTPKVVRSELGFLIANPPAADTVNRLRSDNVVALFKPEKTFSQSNIANNDANKSVSIPANRQIQQKKQEVPVVKPSLPVLVSPKPKPVSSKASDSQQSKTAPLQVKQAAIKNVTKPAYKPSVDLKRVLSSNDKEPSSATRVKIKEVVKKTPAPKVVIKPAIKPKPKPVLLAPVAKKVVKSMPRPTWLASQHSEHVTLQVIASKEKSQVESMMRAGKFKRPAEIFAFKVNGEQWYGLAYGSFVSADQARSAAAELPLRVAVHARPWPRRFGQIQALQRSSTQAIRKREVPVNQESRVSKAVAINPALVNKLPRIESRAVVKKVTHKKESKVDPGSAWVLRQSPQQHTLQIYMNENRSSVSAMLENNRFKRQVALFPFGRNGEQWYGAVYGRFDTPKEAKAAIAELPTRILMHVQPRVRVLGDIQAKLKAAR